MASEVAQICNGALTKLGAKRIASVDEGSPEADLCNERYLPIRDALLAMHVWNHAKKRQSLSPLLDSPATYWTYQYQLPSDYIRLEKLLSNDRQITEYQIENRKILCNEGTLEINYVFKNEDTTTYPPLFTEALELLLAIDMCYRLTADGQLEARLQGKFDEMRRRGFTVDSQEESYHVLQVDYLLNARL